MSQKDKTHIRGKRGQAFADKIRGLNLEHVLCISLDISKYFQVVMIHNALGEIVKPTFEIDIFKTGFEQLCQAIENSACQFGWICFVRRPVGVSLDRISLIHPN